MRTVPLDAPVSQVLDSLQSPCGVVELPAATVAQPEKRDVTIKHAASLENIQDSLGSFTG